MRRGNATGPQENGTQTLLELFDHAVDHLESHVLTIAEKREALGV